MLEGQNTEGSFGLLKGKDGRRFGNTAGAPPISIHYLFSIVPLGQIGVVSPTPETNCVRVVGASTAERIVVVELEPPALHAAPTLLVDESTLIPIAFPYGAPHRRRDIP